MLPHSIMPCFIHFIPKVGYKVGFGAKGKSRNR